MSDRDVDAEFADIIARWDEVETLPDPEHLEAATTDGTTTPVVEDLADTEGNPSATNPSATNPSATNPSPLQPSPTNPPPTRPFVVWRGADQNPAAQATSGEVAEPVELFEDEDDHFVPGPLAPLPPQEDLSFWGIVVGLVAGPLLLLWLVLFRPDVSGWWTLSALGMIVGGFVLLVMRQPHDRDADDPDNGARV